MALIENEAGARRLARAIVSDIAEYNDEKIVQGIQNDNLFEALSEQLEEGRVLFRSRVSQELYEQGIYDRAIVDKLLPPKADLVCKLW